MAAGKPLLTSATDAAAGVRQVISIWQGAYTAKALHSIVKLGVPDILGADAMTCAAIAAKLPGAPDVDMLFRCLRFLASATDLFLETVGTAGIVSFRLSKSGAVLQSAQVSPFPRSAVPGLLYWLHPRFWHGLERLPECVAGELGQDPFTAANGISYREAVREEAGLRVLHEGLSSSMLALQRQVVTELYDWRPFKGKTVVEVSNCTFAMMAAVPEVKTVSIDLSKVEGRGNPMEKVAVPKTEGAILLAHVLEIVSEALCLEIMRSCHAALLEGGRLILMEAVLPESGEASKVKGRLAMGDIVVGVAGGRMRTRAEWEALGARAGFRLEAVVPSPLPECQLLTLCKA